MVVRNRALAQALAVSLHYADKRQVIGIRFAYIAIVILLVAFDFFSQNLSWF